MALSRTIFKNKLSGSSFLYRTEENAGIVRRFFALRQSLLRESRSSAVLADSLFLRIFCWFVKSVFA
ncbi:hypothetical protein RUMCAL_01278 [Ruminococcus callidus ATCC 27760]|uniref:Uncharacterized protein n=1 Tax=Ruminococcus callidus ATCC 27760 TaxID=411473 RepID=U2M3N5_9FIRM|nr:hypothetical protein RUMCAL_01278 [Ruminococcus callidus ATCC 27760]